MSSIFGLGEIPYESASAGIGAAPWEQAAAGTGAWEQAAAGMGAWDPVDAYKDGVFMDRNGMLTGELQAYRDGSLGAAPWGGSWMIYGATAVGLLVIGGGVGALYAKATKQNVKTHAIAGVVAAVGVQIAAAGIGALATRA